MQAIDPYSYQCGVMDCFNEMVKAGVKPLALAHPCATKEERDQYIPYVQHLTQRYQTHYFLDDDPLITDLFPMSLNAQTFNIIFYRRKEDIQKYQDLKQRKKQAIQQGIYSKIRYDLACQFGFLLGYQQETITHYIADNQEKEDL